MKSKNNGSFSKWHTWFITFTSAASSILLTATIIGSFIYIKESASLEATQTASIDTLEKRTKKVEKSSLEYLKDIVKIKSSQGFILEAQRDMSKKVDGIYKIVIKYPSDRIVYILDEKDEI